MFCQTNGGFSGADDILDLVFAGYLKIIDDLVNWEVFFFRLEKCDRLEMGFCLIVQANRMDVTGVV